MDSFKTQLFTSFLSGIGKTSGGLLVAGLFIQLWSLYNSSPSTFYINKSKSSQTPNDIDMSDDLSDDDDKNHYKKIFDRLTE